MYMLAIVTVSKVVARCYNWVYDSNGYQSMCCRFGIDKNGPLGGKI